MDNKEIEVTPTSAMSVIGIQDERLMQVQRARLRRFIISQLEEAKFLDKNSSSYGEGDYGVIPGTKKKCLFKQGAEKLQKIYKYGTRFTLTDKVIDRAQNFAMFTYKAEVFHIASGIVVANQEGCANSQEVKYKSRTTWKKVNVNGKMVSQSSQEETPIFDILNTLMKMAQKRAMVGATILATGASEFFTQDMLEPDEIAESSHTSPVSTVPMPNKPENTKNVSQNIALESPVCCGKAMIVSKYDDREFGEKPFYCLTCKKKQAKDSKALQEDDHDPTMF